MPGIGGLPEPAATVRQSLWPQGSWLRAAFLLTCAGLVLHLASVATRGLSEHRVPWGNMYEFIAAITCAAVLVLVLGAVRFRAYYLGLFVLLPVVLALAVDVCLDLHPGRPARASAPVVLDRHPRDRDDHRDRHVHLRRGRHGAVPAVGTARPPRGRRPGVGVGGHHGADCPAPARSTGWPTGPSCSRSPPGRSR